MNSLFKSIIPYPYFYDNSFENGYKIEQNRECKRCQNRECKEYGKRIDSNQPEVLYGSFECPDGFSCVKLLFNETYVILNGLIIWPENHLINSDRRKRNKQYVVSNHDIIQLAEQLKSIAAYQVKIVNDRIKDTASFLHDVNTSVRIVLACSEKMIDNQEGDTFENKLFNADDKTKNLLNSINLLKEQLKLASIIANPLSITYGKKHRSKIHGFMRKVVSLFSPLAQNKDINIHLRGTTGAEVELYNSFQLLPLILIDNAIKYSKKNHEIIVELHEDPPFVNLSFISIGKVVPEEYKTRIFDKYVRGPNAGIEYSEGTGMGLFLARLIAEAHATSINYCSQNLNAGADDIVGTNIFSIKLRMVK